MQVVIFGFPILHQLVFVKYQYGEKSYLNSSAHIIVKAETNIKIPMVESRKPSNNQSKFIVLWEKMDRTAFHTLLST
jgi:hypothetical protein